MFDEVVFYNQGFANNTETLVTRAEPPKWGNKK